MSAVPLLVRWELLSVAVLQLAMKLSPGQRRRVRRLLRARAADAPLDGELNVVPFLDIVVNLIIFLLATVTSVAVVSEVAAQLPAGPCRTGACRSDGFDVSLTVTRHHVVVSGVGGGLPECVPGAAGPQRIPRNDLAALTACLRRVKERHPGETVTVSAEPDVPFADVLRAMDAARSDERGPLFPDVLLSAGRR